MKNELKLIAELYDKIVLKIDNFGGITKKDFGELEKKESTSIFVYCKDAVHPDFYSKRFEPIANAKSNVTKKSHLHHSYYLRIGHTHNFENSLKQKEKSLFFVFWFCFCCCFCIFCCLLKSVSVRRNFPCC